MANKLNQWRAAKRYQAKLNMLAKFKRECAAELQAKRQADAILDNCVKGRPTGTVDCERERGSLNKYDHVFSMGTIPGSLDKANDNFASLRVASMAKAGEDTRSNAGGMHAQD